MKGIRREKNKASERFEGLSDAAEKTADRATKTPHADKQNISKIDEKSSNIIYLEEFYIFG